MESTSLTPPDRGAFTAWLENQPPDHRFGVCPNGWAESCPLACFLGPGTLIAWRSFWPSGEAFYLPAWAKEFVRRLDRTLQSKACTVTHCLEILREISAS